MFYRSVFSRQTKGIPTHGLHHVFTLHALIAGNNIANGVVAHVTHVQPAARIRKHRQAVELFFVAVDNGFEYLVFFPALLHGRFNIAGAVGLLHHDDRVGSQCQNEGRKCTRMREQLLGAWDLAV